MRTCFHSRSRTADAYRLRAGEAGPDANAGKVPVHQCASFLEVSFREVAVGSDADILACAAGGGGRAPGERD